MTKYRVIQNSCFLGKTKTASADDETETSSMLFNEDDDTSLTNEQTFADEMLHLMEFVDSWTSLEIGGEAIRSIFKN